MRIFPFLKNIDLIKCAVLFIYFSWINKCQTEQRRVYVLKKIGEEKKKEIEKYNGVNGFYSYSIGFFVFVCLFFVLIFEIKS